VTYLIAYGVTAIVFLGLDYIWLGFVAKDFYARSLGSLMRDTPDFISAGIFYLFYVAGIVFFAAMPAESWKGALARGALLGLLAYGTYDMTNLATLKGWPWRMAAVDMAWGAALTALAALGGYLALRSA
jgi:uncharacterized membrane protein